MGPSGDSDDFFGPWETRYMGRVAGEITNSFYKGRELGPNGWRLNGRGPLGKALTIHQHQKRLARKKRAVELLGGNFREVFWETFAVMGKCGARGQCRGVCGHCWRLAPAAPTRRGEKLAGAVTPDGEGILGRGGRRSPNRAGVCRFFWGARTTEGGAGGGPGVRFLVARWGPTVLKGAWSKREISCFLRCGAVGGKGKLVRGRVAGGGHGK